LVSDKESPGRPFGLFRLSVETGEKQRLISPPERSFGDLNPAVSPDGRALVFSRWARSHIRDLYLAELSNNLIPVSEPKRLTFDTNAGDPGWTPDGREIIFSAGSRHTPSLWKLTLSQPGWRPGKEARLAFAGEGKEPAISRQGRLAYGRRSIDVDIWRLELNGGRPAKNPPVRLIASTRVDHEPRYSPDGKRIAFGSNRSGSLELWVCNSDGSNAIQLTSFGGSYYTTSPRWSPDGRLIAFTSTVHGKIDSYVISSEGGRPQMLAVDNLENWSRDGKWIYFGSRRSGDIQLWKMPWPPAASQTVQVTTKGFADLAIESADGKFLYYLKHIGKSDNSLWRLPLEGGEETQVLGSIVNDNFAVLPQGIYFVPSSPPSSIRFLSFATGKEVTVAPMPHEPGWGFSVSPDGRWLLYCKFDTVRADLMLVENFR
jgi:Tol biopolymer transport system component